MSLSPMTRFSLTMQGFACNVPAFGPVAPWLRWTPVLSTIFIFLGTILQQPYILWAFAVVAFVGAAGWNAFDALFNYGVRFVLRLPRLPPNPAPRRFAMGLAATWAAVTGVLFATGWTRSALVAGILLLIAAVTVATTQFCIGSWLWRLRCKITFLGSSEVDPQINVLRKAASDTLPERIDSLSPVSVRAVQELFASGHLQAIDASSFDGPAFLSTSITTSGREMLRDLQERARAKNILGKVGKHLPSVFKWVFGIVAAVLVAYIVKRIFG